MKARGKRFIQTITMPVLLALAGAAHADVDGRWAGALSTPNGDMAIEFVFEEDGGMVTGTSTGPDGATLAINDGKLEGDTLTFSVNVDMMGTPAAFLHKGVVKGDAIDMTIEAFGMPMSFSLTRAAE